MTEDRLYDLSDEELEAQFLEAKDDGVENEYEEPDVVQDDEILQDDTHVVDMDESTEDTEDEEAEDLEQPEDQDSDDDASDEDEADEDESEDLDSDEGEPDEESESEEEQPEDETEEAETEPQPVQKQKFKANGLEYEFDDNEIKQMFPKVFGQAMDYTKKMQQIKPYRKMIDAIEQAQLNQDDLNLAIDVLKGNKDAIGALLKRTGIDALELETDEESNYVPQDYGRDEQTLALKDVVDEISADPEYARTQKVLTNDWDDNSWKELSSNPATIKALHIDVKNGMYDKVQPIASKLKVYDGGSKSDLEYYKEAAKVYFAEIEQTQRATEEQARAEAEAQAAREAELAKVKEAEQKRKSVKQKADKRKSAVPTRKGTGTKKAIDYLEDSDEDFEKWYAQLQDKL